MIEHPRVYTEQLTSAQVDLVIDKACWLLETRGLRIDCEPALSRLAEAGADVADRQARIPVRLVRDALTLAPASFTWFARNPDRNAEVGGRNMLLCPGYGSPFVQTTGANRRPAELRDFDRFVGLAARSPLIDVTGGMLVEPTDVEPGKRPGMVTRSLLAGSDKPLLGAVSGGQAARQSLEMVRTVFGDLDRPYVTGLVNINSPLRLDRSMAEALMEYAQAGQPVLLTPGIMMGMTAPVTVAGALVQAFAEQLGCLALIQAVHPGCPVIFGLGGFGADLRSAGSGFGRPENALAALLGSQVARKLGLPYRSSSAVTGGYELDVRSGYESALTAWAAWAGGVHFVLQAAGTLDCINAMSFEKFAVDLEVWAYLQRLSSRPAFEADDLALELLQSGDGNYLGDDHTVEHMRENLFSPQLALGGTYDTWLANGQKTTLALASNLVERIIRRPGPAPLDVRVQQELDRLVHAYS